MGFISSKRVLIIIADNCELTDNIRYNLPEAHVHVYILGSSWYEVT